MYVTLEPSEKSINEVTFQITEILVKSAKASFKDKKFVSRKSNKSFFWDEMSRGPQTIPSRKKGLQTT